MEKIKYYLPGIALILSGIIIVLFPEILIALFATLVIMAGIGALFVGKIMSESDNAFMHRFRDEQHEDYIENDWNVRKPFYRHYRRWF